MKEDIRESVFLDKIKLSERVIEKQLQLIENINSLKEIWRNNKEVYTQQDIERMPLFNQCWRILVELYDFLKDDKIATIDDSKQKDKKDVVIELHEIMNKYDIMEIDLTINDLFKAYKHINKVVVLAGFHDNVYVDKSKLDYTDVMDVI